MRGICRERSTRADERYLNLFHEEDRDAHEGSVPDPQPVRLHRKTLDQREILCAAADCIATGVDKEWFTQNRDDPEKMGSGLRVFFLAEGDGVAFSGRAKLPLSRTLCQATGSDGSAGASPSQRGTMRALTTDHRVLRW